MKNHRSTSSRRENSMRLANRGIYDFPSVWRRVPRSFVKT